MTKKKQSTEAAVREIRRRNRRKRAPEEKVRSTRWRLAVTLATGLLSSWGGAWAEPERDSVILPEPRRVSDLSVEAALARRRSVREFALQPVSLSGVGQLLWAAQGVTDRKGLRTAPSAGALYPLELYLVAGAVTGLQPGVYHYDTRSHRLSLHRSGDLRRDLARAALDQDWVAAAPAIVVLAGVYERSSRKYGRRAPRYVHMEVGHAAQNLYLQVETLGLGTCAVGAFDDGSLARVLDLPKETRPLLVMPVGVPQSAGP